MFRIRETFWDDRAFGIKTGRMCIEEKLSCEDILDIGDISKDYDLVVVEQNVPEIINDQLLSKIPQMYLCDMLVKLSLECRTKIKEEDPAIRIINSYKGNPAILDISKTAYTYSRFKMDPFLDQEKANTIYLQWCESAFDKIDKFFLTYERNEQIVGYILFHKEKSQMVIELIATAIDIQHTGIGKKMMNRLIEYSQEQGIYKIEVGTQVYNSVAMKFYQKNGFKIDRVTTIYHYWPNKEKKYDKNENIIGGKI